MLKAGFARLDVTPPLGTGLAGYWSPRYAKGVLDPLSLNAIAISDGNETVILITFDALGMREMFCNDIREMIEQATGVPEDHVILSCLHQHTSVVLRPKGGTCALMDETYKSVLFRKFADVAKMAVDDLADATLYISEKQALRPLSFVRRYIMKDGRVKTNPSNPCEDIVSPAEDSDNTVRLLRFVREGKKDIALVNFCTHPDVIGGHRISADWPGFVRRFVEEEHKDTHCILVNGFQGDVNHINFQVPKEERFPGGKGYDHSRYMGRVITDTANLIWDEGVEQKNIKVSAGMDIVFNLTRTDGAEDYFVCKPIYDEFMKTFKIPEDAAIKDLAYLRRVVEMRTDGSIFRKLPVSVLSIGDTVFVGLGGEPFTHYATAIREQVPQRVISVTCANGFEGYLPTAKAFEQGGYEPTASAFTPTLEDECVSSAVALIKKLTGV